MENADPIPSNHSEIQLPVMKLYYFTLKAEPKHFQRAVILVHMKYN